MRSRTFVFLLCATLCPVPASALCTSFGVTATALDFGVYDPAAGTPVSATASSRAMRGGDLAHF